MGTVKVLPVSGGSAVLAACARVVDAGGLVVLPTRRWYMLCADSTDEDACLAIFTGKGRPAAKPLALVSPSTAAVTGRFVVSAPAARLAHRLWPGDLALLLPWRSAEDARRHPWFGADTAMVTRDPGPLGDLAARTRHPLAVAVVSRSDGATAGDREPALSPDAVLAFVEKYDVPVDLLVDGGLCPLGVGLTVVDCASEPTIVRVGAVHPRAIGLALGQP